MPPKKRNKKQPAEQPQKKPVQEPKAQEQEEEVQFNIPEAQPKNQVDYQQYQKNNISILESLKKQQNSFNTMQKNNQKQNQNMLEKIEQIKQKYQETQQNYLKTQKKYQKEESNENNSSSAINIFEKLTNMKVKLQEKSEKQQNKMNDETLQQFECTMVSQVDENAFCKFEITETTKGMWNYMPKSFNFPESLVNNNNSQTVNDTSIFYYELDFDQDQIPGFFNQLYMFLNQNQTIQ